MARQREATGQRRWHGPGWVSWQGKHFIFCTSWYEKDLGGASALWWEASLISTAEKTIWVWRAWCWAELVCVWQKKKSACCSRNGKRWTWNKHHKTMFSQLNENQPRRISGTQAQKTRYKEISLLCLKIPTLSRSFSVCLSNDLLGFVLFFLNLITHHHHHIKRPSSLSSQTPLLKVESGPCLICFEVTCGPRGKKP